MVSISDRFFAKDLILQGSQTHFLTFEAHPRITVRVFKDDPCYVALISVDDRMILKEVMVEDIPRYVQTLTDNGHLHSFLIEYANAF